MKIRNDVLAKVQEEILEPERPIIDPHHHFFDEVSVFETYSLEQLWADTGAHNVEQTVFVECSEHYRTTDPLS